MKKPDVENLVTLSDTAEPNYQILAHIQNVSSTKRLYTQSLFKGTLTRKVFKMNILGDALGLHYEQLLVFRPKK
jgi:hypothetical protein